MTGSSVKRRRTTDLSDTMTTNGDVVDKALKHAVPLIRMCEALPGGGMRMVMAVNCDLRTTGGMTIGTLDRRLTGGSPRLTGRLSGLTRWILVWVNGLGRHGRTVEGFDCAFASYHRHSLYARAHRNREHAKTLTN